MTTKPTVLFVHGAWHDAWCWDGIREKLAAISYPSSAVSLVSPGSKPAVKSHLEDVAVVREELEALIERNGKDVVLVMHSYGGIAGAGAVEGLEKVRRNAEGKKGGVVAALFIAAFLLGKGQSLVGQFPEKPPYFIDDPNDAACVLVDDYHKTFYNDLSEEASKPFISKLRPQPVATFLSEAESDCWGNGMVQCTYLFCEQDQGVYPFLQEEMLKNREADSGKPWNIIRVDASHSVWLSQPNKVVEVIEQCAAI
ncbi:MAG: hypothetical protein M1820_007115 [Bogoriella megaspora]|nr:MAG: hypothetical protein M1820_007115 [Bogoriella megaspora]